MALQGPHVKTRAIVLGVEPGADVIVYAKGSEILRESLQRNPAAREKIVTSETSGFERLLFQTALVRPVEWQPGAVGPVIRETEDAVRLCEHLRELDHERMVVLCLDEADRVTAIHEAGVGGQHAAALLPRDIARVPMLVGAEAIVLLHNHPSGDATPSPDDIILTKRMNAALEALGIHLVDHIVLAGSGEREYTSIRELYGGRLP